jgi:hypothetical protein
VAAAVEPFLHHHLVGLDPAAGALVEELVRRKVLEVAVNRPGYRLVEPHGAWDGRQYDKELEAFLR